MPIPSLEYSVKSQNHRVDSFEVFGDEAPVIYTTDNLPGGLEVDALIKAAYYQVYHEQQMLERNRQPVLESQLKANQITVRDFVRGLATSDSLRRLIYENNNNYRFVQICIQRLLGREVYSEREKFSWSIVLATQGLNGFIDQLLDSEEYTDTFGDSTVPYQRRRILPQRAQGEITFKHMARYGTEYRDQLPTQDPFQIVADQNMRYFRWEWQKKPPKALQQIWFAIVIFGVTFLTVVFLIGAAGY